MDNLLIAGRYVSQFVFVEMEVGEGTMDDREGYDGIIGMRRPPKDDKKYEPFKTTLLDYLVNAGIVSDAIFTFRFCGKPGVREDSWFENGNVVFGGVRADHHRSSIAYVSLYKSRQWMIKIDRIEYGNVLLCRKCLAAVDTGYTVTHAPIGPSNILLRNSVVEIYVDGILHVLPENLPRVRPIKITFASRTFILPPEELTRSTNDVNVFGLQMIQDSTDIEWVLGVSLLRHFLAVFDQQNNRMGFAAVQC
ncbi:hypothetical protein CRM22_010904 [Opisthorchis felineus]|uniref:Peptidase A1 domain-containing protein n=1 Tax=Opisthorchis felineus TaxID=147828 RepID=A0A4S2KK38_OPIFE|nr:hypothetical protein CRM22_010904 [Opisthorchis felineus]TGZ49537.1 hypothetical protein CRM22_010904 [Opisthorchis felineus]